MSRQQAHGAPVETQGLRLRDWDTTARGHERTMERHRDGAKERVEMEGRRVEK